MRINFCKKALKQISLLLCCLILAGNLSAQDLNNLKISVSAENSPIRKILEMIERDYKIRFFYDEKTIDVNSIKSISLKNITINELVNALFEGSASCKISENGLVTLVRSELKEKTRENDKVTVTGLITDESGNPLVNVYVYIKGTNIGTYSDQNGRFSLKNVPLHSVINFDYIGMKSKTLQVLQENEHFRVTLEEDVAILEDVIITGYGMLKKSAYAGSASVVKTENIKDVPTMDLSAMLQGSAPGIQVTGSSGQPGAVPTIRIRGIGSFNASNSPLYVIDGVPVISGDINNSGSDAGTNIMATINTNDIENITVIKDAAAASLYGSRAANGVILITTKTGKKGKAQFNFKTSYGFTDFAYRYRPVMFGDERRDFIYNSMIRRALYQDGKSETEAIAYAEANINSVAAKPWCGWVNWEDVLLRKGSQMDYEFSVSGGAEKFSYFSSLSYSNQEGIQYQQGLERISGRLNVKYDANKWLQLGSNIVFSDMDQDVGYDGMEYVSPIYSSKHKLTCSDAVYNPDGTYNENLQSNGARNPKAALDLNYDKQRVTRSFNTLFAQVALSEDLKLKTTLSYDYTVTKARSWTDPRTSSGAATNGSAYKSYYDYNQMVWSTNLNYIKTFGNSHHIDALIAYEISDLKSDYLSGTQVNFINPEYNAIGNGTQPRSIGGNPRQNRLVSYISKFNYDWNGTYYAGVSYRLDGTSRLHPDKRWGDFWSISGAWRFSNEDFFKPLKEWISDAKFRASYGVNGNLPSSYYAYMSLTDVDASYNEQPGIAEGNIANNNLLWETNYTTNFGLDFSVKHLLDFSFEYYIRKTKNLLMDMPTSLTSGFSSYTTNIGNVKNKGIELQINTVNIKNNDLTWTSTFNLGHNRNKILVLDGIQTEIISGTQIRRVGLPYYTYYMIEFAGINPDNGKPQFYTNTKDENGKYVKDITENSSEAKPIANKSPFPDVTMGLTNTLKYKIIDFSFTLTSTFGGWSYDSAAQKSQTSGSGDGAINQIPLYYKNSWQKPGDITKYEAWIYGNSFKMSSPANSRRLHSTDHVRIKNFTFGISAPKLITNKLGLNSARIFFSAYNLWTFAAFREYDPEVPIDGSVAYNTPPLKTLTFGLDINF